MASLIAPSSNNIEPSTARSASSACGNSRSYALTLARSPAGRGAGGRAASAVVPAGAAFVLGGVGVGVVVDIGFFLRLQFLRRPRRQDPQLDLALDRIGEAQRHVAL